LRGIQLLSGLIFKLFAIEVAFWTTTFWMFVSDPIPVAVSVA